MLHGECYGALLCTRVTVPELSSEITGSLFVHILGYKLAFHTAMVGEGQTAAVSFSSFVLYDTLPEFSVARVGKSSSKS